MKLDKIKQWTRLGCVFVFFSLFVCSVFAASLPSSVLSSQEQLATQRENYKKFNQLLSQKKNDEAFEVLSSLKEYPLYAYAYSQYLLVDLEKIKPKQVFDFLLSTDSDPVIEDFKTQYITYLANKKDWVDLLRISPQPPKNIANQCHFYLAHYYEKDKSVALNGAKALWLSGNQRPKECQSLFDILQKSFSEKKTRELTLKRTELALAAKNFSLANTLVKQLPAKDKNLKELLTKLITQPAQMDKLISKLPKDRATASMVKSQLLYLVNKDLNKSRQLYPKLKKAFRFTEQDARDVEIAIAWNLFDEKTPLKDQQWRDSVIDKTRNGPLLERRLRLALNKGDKKALALWLSKLPKELQQKDIWSYWQADLWLASKNKAQKAKGKALLEKISENRGYYPMLCAQRLKKNYDIRIVSAAPTDKQWQDKKTILRINELLYWGDNQAANREWRSFVSVYDETEQASLARYALEKGWSELSVVATIVGKLWDNLEERFPIAFKDVFKQALANKEISKYYAMAIARQESALNPRAASPVGARGLMQLMPATAKHVAQMAKFGNYKHADQLFDPEINILLGTEYLDYVYRRFDKNRILSTAAYNAGPNRVDIWLKSTEGSLSAPEFIESIPYGETRNYVQNVLAYDLFYRYFLGEKDRQLFSLDEWQYRY